MLKLRSKVPVIRLSSGFWRDSLPDGSSVRLSSVHHKIAGKFLQQHGCERWFFQSVQAVELRDCLERIVIQQWPQECRVATPRTSWSPFSLLGQPLPSHGAPVWMRARRSHASHALQCSVDDEMPVVQRTNKAGKASGSGAGKRKSTKVVKYNRQRDDSTVLNSKVVKQLPPSTRGVVRSPGSSRHNRKGVLPGRKGLRTGSVLQAEAADRKLIEQLSRLLDRAPWDPSKSEAIVRRSNLFLRPVHVCHVLKLQVEAEKALLFFKWVRNREGYRQCPDVYYEVVRILGETRNFQMAWSLLDEISHQKGTILEGTVMTLVKSYLKFNMTDEALHAFYAMDKFGCIPSVSAWNLLLASLVTANSQQAFELFQRMQVTGCGPNSMTYNLLIDRLGRDAKVDAAIDLFQEMKQKGCRPDVATYSILIALLGRSNKVDAAYDLFQEMLVHGCEPNVVVYNTVLDVLGKACKWDLVRTAFKQMTERGFIPDTWSYSILANCFGKAGKMEEAYKVFREMTLKGRFPNSVVFNTFIGNLGRMGQVDASLHLFEHMKQTGHHPCVVTYNTLISMFGKVGKTHRVSELFQEMKDRGVIPSIRTYNSLLGAFRSSGQQDKVLQLFSEMKGNGHIPNVVTYTTLVHTLGGAGDFAGALHILQEMESARCFPDEVLFRVLGKCLEKNGRWDVSTRISSTLKSEGPAETLRKLPRILSSRTE